MYFRTLGFVLLIFTQVSFAQGRKPAVEDFVGIEIDQPEGTPQGTEVLFNFSKDIAEFKETPAQPAVSAKNDSHTTESGPSAAVTVIALTLLLGLPVIIWLIMMKHLRQKAHQESASNIEVLEKYRRERHESKKTQEEFKKVS